MASVDCLTFNVYAKCSRWKDEFPILLEFQHEAIRDFVFLGRLVGTGELAMFSKAALTHFQPSPGNGAAYDYAELVFSHNVKVPHPTSFPATSHKYFIDFLANVAAQDMEPSELVIRRHNFRREPARTFRVRLMGIHTETTISCLQKSGVKRSALDTTSDDELPFGLGKRSKGASGSALIMPSKSKPTTTYEAKIRACDSDADSLDDMSHQDHVSDNDCDSDNGPESSELPVPVPAAGSNDDQGEPEAPEPWNCVGLKCWDIAPSKGAGSVCAMCNSPIERGSYRLDYRFKISKKLGDQRRIHPHPKCTAKLPIQSRDRDLKFLQQAINDDSTAAADKAMLRSVLLAMSP